MSLFVTFNYFNLNTLCYTSITRRMYQLTHGYTSHTSRMYQLAHFRNVPASVPSSWCNYHCSTIRQLLLLLLMIFNETSADLLSDVISMHHGFISLDGKVSCFVLLYRCIILKLSFCVLFAIFCIMCWVFLMFSLLCVRSFCCFPCYVLGLFDIFCIMCLVFLIFFVVCVGSFAL